MDDSRFIKISNTLNMEIIKPRKEDYGYKNNAFPTLNAKIKYELAKTLYLSAKRKENKQKLINDIISNFKDNIFEHEEVIFDLVEEALKTRTQKDLKEWL